MATEFLSQHSREALIDGDEGNLLLTVETSEELTEGLEPRMKEVVRHLVYAQLNNEDKNERKNVR